MSDRGGKKKTKQNNLSKMPYFRLIKDHGIDWVIFNDKPITLLFISLLFAGEMGRQVQEYKFKLTRAEQEVTTLEGSVSMNSLTCGLLKFRKRCMLSQVL